MHRRRLLGPIVLAALVIASASARAGFSDDELRAIYGQMKPFIQCGMSEEHLIEKYRACESSLQCDASLIVQTERGPCVDRLQFINVGGPAGSDRAIILNGHRFPQPVPVAPPKRKPDEVRDSPS